MKKALKEFQKNAEIAHGIKDKYGGKFVAICTQKVVASGNTCDELLNLIPDNFVGNQELYIGYVQKSDEAFIL